MFIHPLSSTTVCHAASLQISDYVVDKQVHVWLLHAETTSAMKSMPCPENTKNGNEYSYDSLLLLAWASFANIFTIEVNTVIRLHNCFNLKTKLRLKQLWRRITMSISVVKIKGFSKPLAPRMMPQIMQVVEKRWCYFYKWYDWWFLNIIEIWLLTF